jgi:hypothetical protein
MTIITPPAASKNKQNFVIDENFSLVGYVIATKLNSCEIFDSQSQESNNLSLQSLQIACNDSPVAIENIVLDVFNEK